MLKKNCLAAFLLFAVAAAPAASELEIIDGTAADGKATGLWLEMLQQRLQEPDYKAVAPLTKPYTAEESAWAALLRSHAAHWEQEIPALVKLFAPVEPPAKVRIVLGNRGADDAFTHKPDVIGFDLAAMQRVYGAADGAGNGERLDRFFRHEYVHLLQHGWWRNHPYEIGTPLRRALAETWAEGLGNHFSLSGRWRLKNGLPSKTARETLAVLEPRFVARLAALACATPERGERLTADLSRGRFDHKWGALTVALWLEAETGKNPDALRALIEAGPDGVWDLAAGNIAPALKPVLDEVRSASAYCRQE